MPTVIMHQTDYEVYKSLSRLHTAYTGLLGDNVRMTAREKLNADKVLLDAQWQMELEPLIVELYWTPFRNGISDAPTDEAKLRRWLEDRYKLDADNERGAIALLLLLLLRYQQRAVNLGGQAGLGFLGLDGTFRLTNPALLAQLDSHAKMLTSQGSEMSLIDTTIADLVKVVPLAMAATGSTLLALGAYIASRSALRTVLIERTERPRQVANGLDWTYLRNGVQMLMYDVNGVGCPQICAPLHGRTFPIGDMSSELYIPQHPNCDCIHSPLMEDWVKPDTIWTGE